MDDKNELKYFLTNECRILYPHLITGSVKYPDRYGLTLLINKSDDETIQMFKKGIDHVVKEKWGNKKPYGLRLPIEDGDSEQLQNHPMNQVYKDHWIAKLGNTRRIRVLDKNVQDITSPESIDKIKSGDWCKAWVNLFAYDNQSKGVSAWVEAVQFVRFGERIDTLDRPPIERIMKKIEGDDLEEDNLLM